MENLKKYWKSIICIIFAGIFIYGKYFVDVTELQELSSTISGYFWILLSILFCLLDKIEVKKK